MLALLVLPLWLCMFGMLSRRFSDWRDAFLAACVIWGIAIAALTEGLSLANAVSLGPLVVAWVLVSLSAVLLWWFSARHTAMVSARRIFSALPDSASQRILLGGICLILVLTACVALIAPPNNFDSMTYHLTRVLNWIDHRSVRHYPTHDLRQLYLGPWAEFAILHLQVLSGGDRFSASVQLISMAGSVIGVSRVASRLGATVQGQLFASVCCVTIPMGILQGSSTQNDYVTAFWLVCFLNSAMDVAEKNVNWRTVTLGGASLGLLALTKTSGLMFAAPFVVWIGISMYGRTGARALIALSWMALWIVALSAPHLQRNWQTFGALLEAPDEAIYQNEVHSPPAIASNIVRNIAVHAAGLPIGRAAVTRAVQRFHRMIGWDMFDRRTTMTDGSGFFANAYVFEEETAGNPLHLLLAGLTIVLCFWFAPGGARNRIYAVCLCAGFLIFSVLLKWQPWISRLELPLFVAATPLVGVVFSLTALRRSALVAGIVLLAVAVLPATRNYQRTLISRNQSILFRDRTWLTFKEISGTEVHYIAAAARLSTTPWARVGVICGGDSWEYPLRMLVREAAPHVQFEYIEVRNSSMRARPESPSMATWADTIVTIDRPDLYDQLDQLRGRPSFASGPIRIYEPLR